MENKRLDELYIFSSLMCCLVIFIHLTSAPVINLDKGSLSQAIFFAFNKGISFVVPCFIFLSGLKLSFTYKNKDFRPMEFFNKRCKRIIIPYLIWYFIYYFYFVDRGFMSEKDISQHLFSFFIGSVVSPFYFITVIFQLYILFGIINYMFRKYNNKILLFTLFILNIIYLRYVYFKYEDRFFMTYLIYFCIGCYAGKNTDFFRGFILRHKLKIIVFFIILTSYYVLKAYLLNVYELEFMYARIFACVLNILAILLFYYFSYTFREAINEKFLKVFKAIDGASYNIFLSHSIVIYMCNNKWFEWGYESIINRFWFTTAVIFPLVFGICIFYNYLKKNLIGKISKI